MLDLFIDEVVKVESSMKYVKIPTLIIGGEDEILVIPECVKKLHNLIRGSKLVMMPNGRHMVCVAEKYKSKDIICDFIKKDILKNKEAVMI